MSDASRFIDKIRAEKIGEYVTELLEGSPQDTLHKIVSLLAEKNAHEVLIPQGHQCAMISLREILRCTNLETTKPSSLMVHVPVLTVEDTIAQAARIMTDYRIRTIPTSDTHKITGQVTSETFLHLLKGKLGDLRISSLATQNLVTIETNATAGVARDLMVRKRIDHLPVKDTSKLAGMVTSDQVVAHVLS